MIKKILGILIFSFLGLMVIGYVLNAVVIFPGWHFDDETLEWTYTSWKEFLCYVFFFTFITFISLWLKERWKRKKLETYLRIKGIEPDIAYSFGKLSL